MFTNLSVTLCIKQAVLFHSGLALHMYFARDLCTWCLCMTNPQKPLVHFEETEFEKGYNVHSGKK